jgi:hypothetical protein
MQRVLARAVTRFAVATGCALGSAALAQAPHPIPPPVRPLHERAAEAEAIALVAAERVERGRIALRLRIALRGELPAAFELKRSPLAPPPIAEGDVALVMLRGARSPYVLAGAPSEVVAARGLSPAVVAAIRAVFGAGPSPDALAKAYVALALTAPSQPHPARELAHGLAEGGLRALCEVAPQAVRRSLPPGPAPGVLAWVVQACGPNGAGPSQGEPV